MKNSFSRRFHQKKLHWTGFFVSVAFILALTAYGFLVSFHPQTLSLDSAPEEPLALVGVALANNIGTGLPRANQIPVTLPQDVGVVQAAILKDGFDGASFFTEHFSRLSEITEVATIDVVSYLRVHPDKSTALDNYIVQSEEKKADAESAIDALTLLKEYHANAITTVQADIKNIQASIEQSYNEKNSDDILSGLAQLEETRITEQEHRNVVVFSERFLTEYKALYTALDKKITVIQANKPALIQGITVSLPEGIDVKALKDLNLFNTAK